MALAAGAKLGPYEILSLVGAGGMGEVYKALDTRLDRTVAIKITREEFSNRFEREARAIASLNHPQVCTLYDIGPNYLVTEFVEGETLRDWLNHSPSAETRLRSAKQVLEALCAAHEAGIVHRDLKPANIMIQPNGNVKVLDFGLAKQMSVSGELGNESTATLGLTAPGQVLGTAAYMSPEQIRGEEVDQRSDLFSFGIILYEILTGRHPWRRELQVDTLHAILHENPPSLASGSTPNPELVAIAQRLLRKNTQERYPSARAALEALEKAVVPRGRTASVRPRGARAKRARQLAVLPLVDLSGEPEHDYFADGMTDALITTLAQISALRVISRTSVMQYKGIRKPLPEIARELNVETILEGTVLRSGHRVRIAAQLIDARTDTHLWAKNYEGELRDILAVQSEVAQAVALEVKITLTPQERARLTTVRPVDPEAYEAFLKGRYYWYRRSPGALAKSVEYLERATTKDPTYAMAHAGLADSLNSMGWDLFGGLPPGEAFPKARQSANVALDLDPECAEAHAALGWTATAYDWDWGAAEKAFRRAIELKPQYGPVHIWYSHFLHAMGRIAESSEEARRAIECDPLGLILNLHLGWHYVYDRQYELAVEQLQKTLELDSGFILARLFLGEAYEQMGKCQEAIAEFEEAVNLSGRRPVYLAGLGHAYAVAGEREKALEIIKDLQGLSAATFVAARGVAEIYIGLAERDLAFNWLEKALAQHNGWLIHTKSNPRYDSIRSDPRYSDLVKRIGLP